MKINPGRTAGILYLLIIIFGLIAQIFVRDTLVNYTDPEITASHILASESWYRFGFVSELCMLICDIGVTTLLFLLLVPSNRGLTILSTLFRFASIIVLSVTALAHYAAIPLLTDSVYQNALNAGETATLALFAIKMHGVGYNVSLLFFGLHLIVLGYLIKSAGLFKPWIGLLLSAGGVFYIVNSIVWFQFPDLVKYIYPVILIPSALGEWIFCFILIIKGAKFVESSAH